MNNWYKTLKKAPWTPPDFVFGPVWTFLYALLAIAFIIVWKNKKCYPYCTALTYFLIQLVLNLMWTTIFFKYKLPGLALMDIVLILIFTYYTYNQFRLISKTASNLLIPYIAWLFVALSMNLYIVLYN